MKRDDILDIGISNYYTYTTGVEPSVAEITFKDIAMKRGDVCWINFDPSGGLKKPSKYNWIFIESF